MNKDRIDEYFCAKAVPDYPLKHDYDKRPGFVYFASDGEVVKIGYSGAPKQRLVKLQSDHPKPLEILLLIPGTHKLERDTHARFSADRREGEWFTFSPKIQSFIQREKDRQAKRTEFDSFADWYKQRKGTFENPEIETQAYYCSLDLEMLRRGKQYPQVRRIVRESFVKLGSMLAAEARV